MIMFRFSTDEGYSRNLPPNDPSCSQSRKSRWKKVCVWNEVKWTGEDMVKIVTDVCVSGGGAGEAKAYEGLVCRYSQYRAPSCVPR